MKILVDEKFEYEGREFQPGETVDLPKSVGEDVVEKGYGEEAGEIRNGEGVPEFGGKSGQTQEETEDNSPAWKKKVWISEDRNISITVWPPREEGKFDSPSVTIQENRRDDSGNWDSNTFYLPTGSNLLALSEYLKTAWGEVRRLRREK